MKKFFLLFVIFSLLVNSQNFAQSIKLRLGGVYSFSIDEANNQYTTGLSSLDSYYQNNFGYTFDLSYYHPTSIMKNSFFLAGLSSENISKATKSIEHGSLLGETLVQNKISPYVGFGINLFQNSDLLSSFVGITMLSAEGENQYRVDEFLSDNIIRDNYKSSTTRGFRNGSTMLNAKYNYSSTTLFRFGFGYDVDNIFNLPVSIGIKSQFDVGTIEREGIVIEDQDMELYPVSDSKISINSASIVLLFGYKFDF